MGEVVSIFARKKDKTTEAKVKEGATENFTTLFAAAERKAADNEERLRKERLAANQRVLRKYRIK